MVRFHPKSRAIWVFTLVKIIGQLEKSVLMAAEEIEPFSSI
jgi:hypothetical protein